MCVFICLRRWLKIAVYLFIQAFKIEDDVKYWRLKLSSVLALRTVTLSVYWHSRLLKFWLCTPSYSSVARILAAAGASYHSDCPWRQFCTFRRLQLFIEFLLLDSAISQLLSLKSFNLKFCIFHPFDSAAWGGEDTQPQLHPTLFIYCCKSPCHVKRRGYKLLTYCVGNLFKWFSNNASTTLFSLYVLRRGRIFVISILIFYVLIFPNEWWCSLHGVEGLVDRLPEELVGRLPEAFPHDTKNICILRGPTLIRILQCAVVPLAPKSTAIGEIKMPSPKRFR